MTTQLPWFIARAAGLMAWALLTASVLWGLGFSSKALGGRPRPNWLLDLHRYLGGLATIFTGLHVGAIALDGYVKFSLASLLVPFASKWRPGAVAWGVVALYMVIAVELTSLARRRLPRRFWRAIHFASFPLFGAATVHALASGTDAHTWVFQAAATAAVATVSGLVAVRMAGNPTRSRARAPEAMAVRAGNSRRTAAIGS